jgi:hypothetical protein
MPLRGVCEPWERFGGRTIGLTPSEYLCTEFVLLYDTDVGMARLLMYMGEMDEQLFDGKTSYKAIHEKPLEFPGATCWHLQLSGP